MENTAARTPHSGAVNSPAARRRQGVSVATAMSSCEYYPVGLDPKRRLISFARISRETYRRTAFLVPRHGNLGRHLYTFNLDDLLLYDMNEPSVGARSRYILISAFCCSTLLARYLDLVPGCFVLKEPGLLGQLGMCRFRTDLAEPGTEWEAEWHRLAQVGLRLLTRTFASGDTVVIKAADVCNTMGEAILEHDARSRLLLLSVGLRTFVLSVLKLDNRRVWMRERAKFWSRNVGAFPVLANIEVDGLEDAEKSAYLWLVTDAYWNRLRQVADPDRILLMDGEEISESPGTALGKITTFFDLPVAPERLEKILASPSASRHSKFPSKSYDAVTRRRDVEDWERRFGAETDRAMEWAAKIRKESGLPCD